MRNKEVIQRKQRLAKTTYQAYRGFFSSEDGKTVLQDLMRSCCFMRNTIGQSPEETYFNEGRRSVVLSILKTSKMSNDEINTFVGDMEAQDKELYHI